MAPPVRARRWFEADADLACLAPIRAFVREGCAAAGATDEATADLVQAVDEAATNVIVHGYGGRPGSIEVVLETDDERLVCRLLDDAPPFDPASVPPPDLGVPPLDRQPGGMGVHLMRELTDELRHRSRPTGGNELTLIRARGERGGPNR